MVDAFVGARVPADLTTVEFFASVRRVLTDDGLVVVNLTDRGPFDYARRVLAGLTATFPYAAFCAEPATLKGRRFGNLILLGSGAPLPLARLAERAGTLALPLPGPARRPAHPARRAGPPLHRRRLRAVARTPRRPDPLRLTVRSPRPAPTLDRMSLGSPPPSGPSFQGPSWAPPRPSPELTDRQLQQLPPPVPPGDRLRPAPAGVRVRRNARCRRARASIGLACNLAVTASLLWICALSLAWVTATAGADRLAIDGETGPLFHILNRFDDRMVERAGLAALSLPRGLLRHRSAAALPDTGWARIVHTALGLAALGWTAWWLQDNLLWWVSSAFYIAVACLLVWTPGASRWYARRAVLSR